MEQYAIRGGNPLVGEVEIGGAKNASLAILAAAVMTDETVLIENIPDVRDTNVMMQAIESIGGTVERVDRHTAPDFRQKYQGSCNRRGLHQEDPCFLLSAGSIAWQI